MRIIKKLDMFVLKKFLLIFFGSFFITLFVFMMQFTWRYVDELIGKGLTMDLLVEFFWHMSLTMVPMSLPLSILLASLISFGNMGERLELLAIKAAGVPLKRIMRPVGIFCVVMAMVSFHFQNKIAPEAQLKLRTLLFSMRQTSPALEIPESVFYNNIPGLSMFVEKKNVQTGMLYKVMIYKLDQGFERAQIIVADSGRLETSDDKYHLVLDLWNGKEYEALKGSSNAYAMGGMDQVAGRMTRPFMRQTFSHERFIIDFDSNFEKMDADQLRGMATAKNLKQLSHDIDSMRNDLDSLGGHYYSTAQGRYFKFPQLSEMEKKRLEATTTNFNIDSLLANMPASSLRSAEQLASVDTRSYENELEWRAAEIEDGEHFMRLHEIEWHKKFTFSLACIFFFLIGAPLGAIIRKGGLGLPAVVSVIIFIIYYIIDTSGMKMAREGSWNMLYGMWISTIVLFPLGIYITYKANKDSVVFNLDTYLKLIRRWLGWRDSRHLVIKEVILNVPNNTVALHEAEELCDMCARYSNIKHLYLAPSYIQAFFLSKPDHRAEIISDRLEQLVVELSNTRDIVVLTYLNSLPMMYVHSHTSPFENRRLNILCGVFFPVGIVLWLRIWRFRLRLFRDMRKIKRTLQQLIEHLEKTR